MSQFAPENNYKLSDEIDLVELFESLWKQKLVITLFACAVTVGAAAYAFLATPQYEVRSMLRLASTKDLAELNSTGVYKLSPSAALKSVGASLDSYATRMSFFKENAQLLEPLQAPDGDFQQSFDALNRNGFKILQPDSKRTDNLVQFVGVQLTYPATIDGVKILNGLVASALEQERARIAVDLAGVTSSRLAELERKMKTSRAVYEAEKQSKIAQLSESDNLKRAQLQDELKALRQELKTLRMQRVTQLAEAANIAKSLGIIKPSTPSALGEVGRDNAVNGNVIRTEVFNQQFPLYFMGVEALEAERAALLQRRSDDFTSPRVAQIQKKLQLLEHNRQIEVLNARENKDLFLADLSSLRKEEARLKNINLDLSELQLVIIDQQAELPSQPVAPNKILIIGCGLIIGVFLGVVVVLVRVAMIRRKKEF